MKQYVLTEDQKKRKRETDRAWHEKHKGYSHDWYIAHKERHAALSHAWYEAHREQRDEATRNWYMRPGRYAAKGRADRKKYPERNAIIHSRRRARLTKAGGSYTPEQWKALIERCDYKCLACQSVEHLTADHVVPVKLGGSSDISNIQVLCQSCNSKKHTKIIDYRWDVT